LAVIDFLNTSTTDGTLSADDKESIEVATQCIADAFKVDPENKEAMADALGGQSLVAIYNVFEKMKGKTAAPKPTASPAPAGGAKQPTDAEKAEAEALKSKGNAAINQKDYKLAIDYYTQALAIHPTNPIYLSNRAAAYSNIGDYDSAIRDAEIAVDTDPSYSKGWSRLGHARFSKGEYKGAMEAYKAGIDAEGNGGTQLMKVGYETAKKKYEQEEADRSAAAQTSSPRSPGAGGLGGLAGLAGGLPGGFDELMKNPFVKNMMQQVMNNPEKMEELMNSDMLKGLMGGGGAELFNNPQFAAM
jgi:small glutamine-rich tetratricopeptide repeat-containing protein alpha